MRIALPVLLLTTASAQAQEGQGIAVGFRLVPPYVMQQPDGRLSGLEYELVIGAAQAGGLTLRPELAPFGRLPEDFRRKGIDAFSPANAKMELPGCLSDTVLIFQNLAFSLKHRGLKITGIADLGYHDVAAFQNAHRVLGPEMDAVRHGNPRYREIANQMLQVRALFSGRTDVVIADRRIFRYLMQSPDSGIDTSAPLAEHDLFPPTPYAVAFQQPAHCAAFNAGLELLKRRGDYDRILESWESKLQANGSAASPRAPG